MIARATLAAWRVQANLTWHTQSAEAVLAHFGTTATGLTSQEEARRLAADGPNALREGRRISRLRIVASQFKSLLIWILLGAGAVSAVLGQAVDALSWSGPHSESSRSCSDWVCCGAEHHSNSS